MVVEERAGGNGRGGWVVCMGASEQVKGNRTRCTCSPSPGSCSLPRTRPRPPTTALDPPATHRSRRGWRACRPGCGRRSPHAPGQPQHRAATWCWPPGAAGGAASGKQAGGEAGHPVGRPLPGPPSQSGFRQGRRQAAPGPRPHAPTSSRSHSMSSLEAARSMAIVTLVPETAPRAARTMATSCRAPGGLGAGAGLTIWGKGGEGGSEESGLRLPSAGDEELSGARGWA